MDADDAHGRAGYLGGGFANTAFFVLYYAARSPWFAVVFTSFRLSFGRQSRCSCEPVVYATLSLTVEPGINFGDRGGKGPFHGGSS